MDHNFLAQHGVRSIIFSTLHGLFEHAKADLYLGLVVKNLPWPYVA